MLRRSHRRSMYQVSAQLLHIRQWPLTLVSEKAKVTSSWQKSRQDMTAKSKGPTIALHAVLVEFNIFVIG